MLAILACSVVVLAWCTLKKAQNPATARWNGVALVHAPAQWLRAPLTGVAPGSYRVDVASTRADSYGDFYVILGGKRHSIENGSVRAGTVSPRLTPIGEVTIGLDSFIQFESAASSPENGPQRIGVSGVYLQPMSGVHP